MFREVIRFFQIYLKSPNTKKDGAVLITDDLRAVLARTLAGEALEHTCEVCGIFKAKAVCDFADVGIAVSQAVFCFAQQVKRDEILGACSGLLAYEV